MLQWGRGLRLGWGSASPRSRCRSGNFNGVEACASDGTVDPWHPWNTMEVLQWGRGLRLGWDRTEARISAKTTGFNGAEACASDGTQDRRAGRYFHTASMGPRLAPRMGRFMRSASACWTPLQWGRGLRLGWDFADDCSSYLAGRASMGPRLAPRMGLPVLNIPALQGVQDCFARTWTQTSRKGHSQNVGFHNLLKSNNIFYREPPRQIMSAPRSRSR